MCGRTLLVCLSLLLSFILVDYVSIFFISNRSPFERQFPVEEVRHPKPFVMFGGLPNAGNLNARGYMGRAPDTPKPEDEFRIFLVGGSTVLQGNPTLAELLEQQCARTGLTHVKIYNYGVVSSGSGQDLARVVYEISDLEPDLIIFYNGANDTMHPKYWDPRPGYPFNFVVYEKNPLLESSIRDYPALALLAYGSNILRTMIPGFLYENLFLSIQ